MTPKGSIKIYVDMLMTIGLLFVSGYQIWGEAAHEWAGAGLFGLFIFHHWLNRSSYPHLFRGSFTPLRVVRLLLDLLVLAVMLIQMYSGPSPLQICIRLSADRKRVGAGQTPAHPGRVLGHFADESPSRAALEDDPGQGAQKDAYPTHLAKPNDLYFGRRIDCWIWRSGIDQTGFFHLSVPEK